MRHRFAHSVARIGGLGLALGLGCLALAWGLTLFYRTFTHERDDAMAALAAQRGALTHYARLHVADTLRRELDLARPRIEAAIDDPLASDDGLLFIDGDLQVLPRISAFDPGSSRAAVDLLDMLRRGTSPDPGDDTTWQWRLDQFRALRRAIARNDEPSIVRLTRELLAHQAYNVVPAARDVPYTIAVVEALIDGSRPHIELLRGLLHDGLRGQSGVRLEALQRKLLRHHNRLTIVEFAALSNAVEAVSERAGIPYDDFKRRSKSFLAQAEKPLARIKYREPLAEPTLIEGGLYVAMPHERGGIFGLRVSLADAASQATAHMRATQLVDQQATIRATNSQGATSLAALPLDVTSPEWPERASLIERQFRFKLFLLLAVALLALVVVALTLLARMRAQRFVHLRDAFVRAVAHELRTPLASMRLIVETLERRLSGVPEARDYPRRLARDVEGLTALVDNVLSGERLRHGGWVLNAAPVDLKTLVDEVASRTADYTTASVHVETAGLDGISLTADRELLTLLFSNLFRNACLYNQRDPVRIALRATPSKADISIAIADNGVGIPEGDWERVFREFERGGSVVGDQTSAVPRQPHARGTGLGLNVCRRIAELHRGSLRIAASSPEGTTFALTLPREATP